jgi:hypothetical protein
MKKIILSIVVLGAFLFVLSINTVLAQTPEKSVRAFYVWYLTELDKEKNPIKDDRGLSRFVTNRFRSAIKRALNREEGIDADVFIDAQDWDPLWVKNISTSRAVITGNRSTVTVTLRGGPNFGTKRLKVAMRKEPAAWKIDSVNGVANP